MDARDVEKSICILLRIIYQLQEKSVEVTVSSE